MNIEIFPVGLPDQQPTRFDLVGIDDQKNRYYLTYLNSADQAEIHKTAILEFITSIVTFTKAECSRNSKRS